VTLDDATATPVRRSTAPEPRRGADGADGADTVVLPADPASTRGGRRHVAARCREHQVPQGVADEAVLITSELVTNAVLHGRSAVAVTVVVTTTAAGGVLRVAVDDDNSRHPAVKEEDAAALDGRGLHIVDALADRWGVSDRGVGKTVWFEIVFTAPPA
jgi:anti-sigma regulatory factor (Ser/Thr protein kinase)